MLRGKGGGICSSVKGVQLVHFAAAMKPRMVIHKIDSGWNNENAAERLQTR